MNFAQEHQLDQTLAKVGIFFCLGITMIAFFLAVRTLPFNRSSLQLPQLGQVVSAPKAAQASPLAFAPAPTEVPTVAPTPIAAASADSSLAPAFAPSAQASVPPRAQTPVAKASPTPTPDDKSYTVQSGDTIYSVARHYGVSPTSLAASNGLSSSTGLLKVGQPLKIP
jgi:membrane-bound lytic murein transglycosylase D